MSTISEHFLGSIEKDFSTLMDFVDDLAGQNEQSDDPVRKILGEVTLQFKKVAKRYFDLAKEVIGCADEYLGRQPREGRTKRQIAPLPFYYGFVLRKISDHIGLLADLNRQLQTEEPKQKQLMEAIVWGVTSRFEEAPVLIPVQSARFRYVHFNYLQSFGLIGYPVYVLANPLRDLPVLWHEVAGFQVALERSAPLKLLEKRAKDLRDQLENDRLLDWYLTQYQDSVLERGTARLDIHKPGGRIDNAEDIRRYFRILNPQKGKDDVKTDIRWQMVWLGEFIEDLFGVQALKGWYFQTLADVLVRYYPAFDLGDSKHPSPELRLQVVLEFLKRIEDSPQGGRQSQRTLGAAIHDLVRAAFATHPVLSQHLSFDGKTPNEELARTASVIVSSLFDSRPEQQAGLKIQLDQREEDAIALANEIRADPLLDYGARAMDLRVASIRTDFLNRLEQYSPQPSPYLWTMSKNQDFPNWSRQSGEPCDASGDEPLRRLEQLRKIEFTESDANGGGGQTPPILPFLPGPS